MAGYGIPLWTPTGERDDALPVDTGKVDAGQGWEFVDVDGERWPGLKRVWWNQSRFEDMRMGGRGTVLGFCYGDYSPVFEDVEGPVE